MDLYLKNNLKELLEMKNTNILQLSKNTGICYSTVYNLVNHENLVTAQIGHLIKMAIVLNVNPDDLYEIK